MKGTLIGIGVGPGDPDLLTLKAVGVLGRADAVVVPQSREDRQSIALEIARPHIRPGTTVVPLTFPMTRDPGVRRAAYEENAGVIRGLLGEGKLVVFLTLGDALLYSTYGSLVEILLRDGYPVLTVPGIPAFCAAAARMNLPLARKREVISIVPLEPDTDIEAHLGRADTTVFLKASACAPRLAAALRKAGDAVETAIASREANGDERFTRDLSMLEGNVPYLTTVIVKKRVPEEYHG